MVIMMLVVVMMMITKLLLTNNANQVNKNYIVKSLFSAVGYIVWITPTFYSKLLILAPLALGKASTILY